MHPRRATRVRGAVPDREGFSGRGVRYAGKLAVARPRGPTMQGGLARLVSCIGFNGALPAPESELAKSRSTGSVCTRAVDRNSSTRMSRHTSPCERATHVDQDTPGRGGNARGYGRVWRPVTLPGGLHRSRAARSRCAARSVPEHADRVVGELAKEVIEPTTRTEERVALPPACVAKVVQSPESFGGDVAKPGDRQPRPIGAEVIAPGRPPLDDVDRLALPLELDANLRTYLSRHSRVAHLLNPRDITLAHHETIVRGRPDRSALTLGEQLRANLI